MTAVKKLDINLAGRPRRNRRSYFIALTVLVLLAGLLLGLGLSTLIGTKARESRALAEYDRLDEIIKKEERARTQREAEIKILSARTRDRVDLVNAAILKKSFRWTEFFTMLEGALPAASYISSMAPVSAVEGRFEIKFKVVSRTMADLLRLTQNLLTVTGHPPLILNETRTAGQLVSEITLTYEKSR
jgi:hypothetical protein